jgi:nucleotide-binding universal stress UspA family protein
VDRIQTVVCPVDFFPASEAALSYAISIARNYDAGLHLLHVIPPVSSVFGSEKHTGELVKKTDEDSQVRLGAMAQTAKASGVEASFEVRFGEIDQEILNGIAEQDADLIVVGTHGRRGFQHWLMGSVCERLLRRVSTPILTVSHPKKTDGGRIERILVATDLSDSSSEVAAWASSIAQKFESDITLLHVTDFVMGGVPHLYRDSLLQGINAEMKQLLPPDVAEKLKIKVETRVEFGIPFRVVLTLAEQEKFDLIVLGTHGKSALERTLLGSTAERVLRGASCPILAIPPIPQVRTREVATRTKMATRLSGSQA